MDPQDQEEARRELIKRGVIKEPDPQPAPEPTPPKEPPQAASWWCAIRHRWTRWEYINVTILAFGNEMGEKTHQRRWCQACGKVEIAEVFV